VSTPPITPKDTPVETLNQCSPTDVDADEYEDEKRDPDLEVAEEAHDAAEGKVEGAQAEDRKDVGGEGDEAVLGDREHGRQGIEGETSRRSSRSR